MPMLAASNSRRDAISTPIKQGWRMGGAHTRICTSVAPPRRSNPTTWGVVVPRTMLSSTTTMRLPRITSPKLLNF